MAEGHLTLLGYNLEGKQDLIFYVFGFAVKS